MKYHVLFLDDHNNTNEQQMRRLLEPHNLSFTILHPEDVTQSDIDGAKVVVVDYFLEDWDERDASESLARAPRDGLAVAATLRSTQLPSLDERGPGVYPRRPIAFALWSGHLTQASFNLPEVVLPHAFSRENNLEWAFSRHDLVTDAGARQLASLCDAVNSAEGWTPSSDGLAQLMDLLDMHEDSMTSWYQEAVDAVTTCRPPLRELATSTHGMALVRWMLHRVIPYPTFLVSENEIGMRLGLMTSVSQNPRLQEILETRKFTGTLANFDGPRWWRAGFEDWLYNVTGGQSNDPVAISTALSKLDVETEAIPLRPVLTLDASLRYEAEASDVEDVVRIRPEDWPPYAEPAYARIALALDEPDIRQLVDPIDADILNRRDR